ncbi:MAG: 3-isopropylmalate dehydratase small subunit [Syntrophomonadaceae bacterium]|nr:3-isopropylmalate dehydratase small subunit [Syntrophomonadaceae bacterium]
MILSGRVHKFGADIDTDAIIPARYLNTFDPGELAQHCMEDADPRFPEKVQAGDIIAADKNFGCGSSREHAPIAIKGAGVSCVIAKSFARIFYRNCINVGLPILECSEAVDAMQDGDPLQVDLDTGKIINLRSKEEYQAMPFPPFMQQIMDKGGLINYVKERKERDEVEV